MSAAKAQLEKLPRSIQFVLALGAIALAAFPFVPMDGSDFYLGMLDARNFVQQPHWLQSDKTLTQVSGTRAVDASIQSFRLPPT